eukprot:1158282-Pelagomonas_calceolata.AAC.3
MHTCTPGTPGTTPFASEVDDSNEAQALHREFKGHAGAILLALRHSICLHVLGLRSCLMHTQAYLPALHPTIRPHNPGL